MLDGELTTITSNIDLPLDRYVIIIFQREGGRWCGQQQSRVGAVVIGSFMAMAWWRMAWGLRWACLLSMGNDNMKNKKEERERGLGDIDHVSHRHITCVRIFWTDEDPFGSDPADLPVIEITKEFMEDVFLMISRVDGLDVALRL